ncbi:Unknown protein sequence [Pseudomonas syringae pv. maculicola]|nr:Unknown protein sequence [Pseudomonas syringae pv. maculicola]
MFKVDVQAVKAIDFDQANDFIGQWFFLARVQLDVRISAAQRNQHCTALCIQCCHLSAKRSIAQVIRLEGRDASAFHEGHCHDVISLGNVCQRHLLEQALLVALTGFGRPVVPEAHENIFASYIRHVRGCVDFPVFILIDDFWVEHGVSPSAGLTSAQVDHERIFRVTDRNDGIAGGIVVQGESTTRRSTAM